MLGQHIDGAAKHLVDLRIRQNDGVAGRHEEAVDGGRLIGHVQDLAAGRVGDNDLARDAAIFLKQCNDVFLAFGAGLYGNLGAADTDGRDGRANGHGVGAGLGDRAGYETKYTLNDGNGGGALMGFGVVNQFVQHHAPVLAQRERRVIDKGEADRALAIGFKDIALVDRITGVQGYPGTVSPDRRYRTGCRFDRANGLRRGAAARGIRHHVCRGGTRQSADQIAG